MESLQQCCVLRLHGCCQDFLQGPWQECSHSSPLQHHAALLDVNLDLLWEVPGGLPPWLAEPTGLAEGAAPQCCCSPPEPGSQHSEFSTNTMQARIDQQLGVHNQPTSQANIWLMATCHMLKSCT
jgi:hypothetical protein